MTWPAPEPVVAHRVRAAHARARAVLTVHAAPGAQQAWGWEGRTLGMPVTTPAGRAMWLRLATSAADNHQPDNPFWIGTVEAQHQIPAAVPRPRLRRWHEWIDPQTEPAWIYRAELYDHATTILSAVPAVTTPPAPPASWWAELRAALDTITAVPTTRRTVHPGFLRWAIPRYLTIAVTPPDETGWTTAHGDLHFANLTGPRLQIIDWEGWGRAPAGYDAAMLHLHSLLVPDLAAQVHRELAHLLDTDAGPRTELCAIAELLHANAHAAARVPSEALRRRSDQLVRQLQLIPTPP